MQKILSAVICLILFFETMVFSNDVLHIDNAEQVETYVDLVPTDDTCVRNTSKTLNTNYGSGTALTLLSASAGAGGAFVRFSAENNIPEVDNSDRIILRFFCGNRKYASDVLIYPMYDIEMKNFDEMILTHKIADSKGMMSYTTEPLNIESENMGKWTEVDITDYCKSQLDGVFAFKIVMNPNSLYRSFTISSKENPGFEPTLRIYTSLVNDINKTIDLMENEFGFSKLTENVDLPTTYNDCSVVWESSDENIIDNNGIICERPDENIAVDTVTTLTAYVTKQGKTIKHDYSVRVLNKRNIPCTESSYTRGGIYSNEGYGEEKVYKLLNRDINELIKDSYIKFNIDDVEKLKNADNVYLRLYLNNSEKYQKGSLKATLVSNDSINDFNVKTTYSEAENIALTDIDYVVNICGDSWVNIEITDAIQTLSTDTIGFKLQAVDSEIQLFSNYSDLPPVIIFTNGNGSVAEEILCDYDFGNIDNVISDLDFVQEAENVIFQWSTDNNNYIDTYGNVIRPLYYEGDKKVKISVGVELNGANAYREMTAIVKKQQPANQLDMYKPLQDPMKMSDEEFFGCWNKDKSKWDVIPILKYEDYDGLEDTLNAVKDRNYKKAKYEILDYYKQKAYNSFEKPEPDYYSNITTDLYAEGIYTTQTPLAEFSVDDTLRWHSISLDSAPQSVMIYDRDKSGSTALFYSKQSEYAPYLEYTYKGKRYIQKAYADTYLSSASNKGKCYGKEKFLYACEDGHPVSDNTKRIFINFDAEKIPSGVTNVSLNVYGLNSDGNGEMNLIVFADDLFRMMDEDTVKWEQSIVRTYSYVDEDFKWDTSVLGADSAWLQIQPRFRYNTDLTAAYLGTGDLKYAYGALKIMESYYTFVTGDPRRAGAYARPLDLSWQTEYFVDTMIGLIDCGLMTPEFFTSMLKYTVVEIDYLRNNFPATVTNQLNARLLGIMRLITYYPELCDLEECLIQNETELKQQITRILNSDDSYTEACTSYYIGVAEELIELIRLYDEFFPDRDYSDIVEVVRKLAVYSVDMSMPDFCSPGYGDGSWSNMSTNYKMFSDYFPDDETLKYVASGGQRGEKPNYTSKEYPVKGLAFMRDGWDKNSLWAFINTETNGSHGHPDDLALSVYGYGKHLLVDPGNGGGYNPAIDSGYVRIETFAHNTIEINDKPQLSAAPSNSQSLLTNDKFDFYYGVGTGYSEAQHERKVFFKRGDNGFFIVNDILTPSNPEQINTYKQNWHPYYENNLVINDDGSFKTNFNYGANIMVVQEDMTDITVNKSEGFVGGNIADYVYYEQSKKGDTTYNTLLYPIKEGEDKYVTMNPITLDGVAKSDASAFLINTGDTYGFYYVSNESVPRERVFGHYKTDAEMSYIENDNSGTIKFFALTNGNSLHNDNKVLFETSKKLSDISVSYSSSQIEICSSGIIEDKMTLYCEQTPTKVFINNQIADFTVSGNYITVVPTCIKFEVGVENNNSVANVQSDINLSASVQSDDKNETVTLTIYEGTIITGEGNWDGTVSLTVTNNGNSLTVKLGGDKQFAFSKAANLKLPFSVEGECSIGSSGIYTFERPKETLKPGANVGSTNTGGFGGGAGGGSIGNSGGGGTNNGNYELVLDKIMTLSDVNGHWAEKEISSLVDLSVINGDENNKFNPDNKITRAEFLALAVRAFDVEALDVKMNFTDVKEDSWYYPIVERGCGIISGFEDGTFRPDLFITREQAVKILVGIYELYKNAEAKESLAENYYDYVEISDWALPYVEKALSLGLISGTDDNKLKPISNITRAESAVVIYRLINKLEVK